MGKWPCFKSRIRRKVSKNCLPGLIKPSHPTQFSQEVEAEEILGRSGRELNPILLIPCSKFYALCLDKC